MSDACLLGDYLIKRSAIESRTSGRPTRRRPAPILVLWHPLRQATQQDIRAATAEARCPPSFNPRAFAVASPAAAGAIATTKKAETAPLRPHLGITLSRSAAATFPTPAREGSQGERGCGGRRRVPSRRSVQRRCDVVVRFSGLQRGTRGGLGIRPLS
ncbi:unnamed protein product [Hapterophycus canaliculatus]